MLVKVLAHKTKPNIFGCPDYNCNVIEEHSFPFEIALPEANYLKGLSDWKFANIEDYEEQIWELTPKKD